MLRCRIAGIHLPPTALFCLCVVIGVVAGCRQAPDPTSARNANLLGPPSVGERLTVNMATRPIMAVTNEYMEPIVSSELAPHPIVVNIPSGLEMVLCVTAEPGGGGPIVAVRYAWDLLDPNDPDQWEPTVPFDGSEICLPPRKFFFGTHTWWIEVVDAAGNQSRVRVIQRTVFGPPSLDIMPGTCKNHLSPDKNGLIKIVVPGMSVLPVEEIDETSLKLWIDRNPIEPLRYRIGDAITPAINSALCGCVHHGPDGIDDIILMFSAKEIVDALGAITPGDVEKLSLRGSLHNQLQFDLQDCVTIVGSATKYPPLQSRDAVLKALEESYNDKDIEKASSIIDDDFTFFFGASDISEGNVDVAEWDAQNELAALPPMFAGPALVRIGSGVMTRFAESVIVENTTWGRIKYAFRTGQLEGIATILLSMTYVGGENAWIAFTPGDEYPGETWYEKSADYFLVIEVDGITFTNITPLKASFVVRFDEDHEQWQLVHWRDDIGAFNTDIHIKPGRSELPAPAPENTLQE